MKVKRGRGAALGAVRACCFQPAGRLIQSRSQAAFRWSRGVAESTQLGGVLSMRSSRGCLKLRRIMALQWPALPSVTGVAPKKRINSSLLRRQASCFAQLDQGVARSQARTEQVAGQGGCAAGGAVAACPAHPAPPVCCAWVQAIRADVLAAPARPARKLGWIASTFNRPIGQCRRQVWATSCVQRLADPLRLVPHRTCSVSWKTLAMAWPAIVPAVGSPPCRAGPCPERWGCPTPTTSTLRRAPN